MPAFILSMNNAAGLEIVPSGRYQQGAAVSPMRVAGQKAIWDLSATPPSGAANTPVSFQALLAAKGVSLPNLETDDPGADQVVVDAHSKGPADDAQSKSNLTKLGTSLGTSESRTPPVSKSAPAGATTAAHTAVSQPWIAASLLPAQPESPVRKKTEGSESQAQTAPAGSSLSRNKRRSGATSETGGSATGLPEATAPVKAVLPENKSSLNSPAPEPSQGGVSLGTATAEPRGDSRLSSHTTAEALGGDDKSSPGTPTAVRDYGAKTSLATTTISGPRSGRVSSPAGSTNNSEVQSSETTLEANAASVSDRNSFKEPAARLENGLDSGLDSGLKGGHESDVVSKKESSQPTDRSTPNAHSLLTSPSGSSDPAHKVMNPVAALTDTVSSKPVPSKRATASAPQGSNLSPAVLPSPDKTISALDQKTPALPESNQGPHIVHSGSHSSLTQPPAPSAFTRETSSIPDMHSIAPATTSDAGSSRPGSAKVNTQDTFAALDEQPLPSAPVWIHTGGNVAEAGFKDPTLGWVGVRAQADAGGVHAAVVPASADASQALSSNMTNLSAYLNEHHTPVQTLTMATPESSLEGRNTDHSGSGNTGQRNAQGGNSEQQQAPGNSTAPPPTGVRGTFSQTPDPVASSSEYFATGAKYISVIA